MAGSESVLLTQCLCMVNELVTLKIHASLNVRIGDNFNFEFSSHNSENGKKKLSPSSRARRSSRAAVGNNSWENEKIRG